MAMPTLTELLEAGAHFGHKKEKSYPRAKQFTFAIRDNIYVINLELTISQLKKAIEFLKKSLDSGKIVLFIGTKSQAREATKKLALALGMPYMTERWLGGTLTNFESTKRALRKLSELSEQMKSPDFLQLTKKERKIIEDKKNKLELIFQGLDNLKNLPDVLFIVDTVKEKVAVAEGRKLNLPMVGICDTNANPDLIDIPIPANDDSSKTLTLILSKIEEGLRPQKTKEKK